MTNLNGGHKSIATVSLQVRVRIAGNDDIDFKANPEAGSLRDCIVIAAWRSCHKCSTSMHHGMHHGGPDAGPIRLRYV